MGTEAIEAWPNMDTEKLLEIEHKIEQGKPLSDEGPYYHHAWWESYKGASKGELGGTVVGAMVGTVVGVGAALTAAVTGLFPLAASFWPIVIGCAAGGLIYGVHKFSNVGAVTGAISSSAQQGEARIRAFEEGKFSELKQEIGEIKNMLKGRQEAAPKPQPSAQEIEADLDQYRTTHYAKLEPPRENRYVFWKIALMGLVVGMAAGALLAAASGSTLLASVLGGGHIAKEAATATYAAYMLAVGALGASFGINRDVFRRVFDKTDLWFKGIFSGRAHDIVEAKQIKAGEDLKMNGNGKHKDTEIATVTANVNYEGAIDYPTSSTYHRDKVLAAAEKALLSFDHTRATPQ